MLMSFSGGGQIKTDYFIVINRLHSCANTFMFLMNHSSAVAAGNFKVNLSVGLICVHLLESEGGYLQGLQRGGLPLS